MSFRWALLLCLLASSWIEAAPATAPTTQPRRWELFANGSADRIWYAVTSPPGVGAPDVHTFIRTRETQGKWESLSDFPGRMISMSPAGGRLVVALDGGEWKRIAPGQFLSGSPLPGGGEILSIAADDGGIWAVGVEVSKISPATTRASTMPSVTTAPVVTHRTRLFHFEAAGWRNVADVPPPVVEDGSDRISLLLVGHVPTLAFVDAADRVVISQWRDGPDAAWVEMGSDQAGFPIRKISLLNLDGKLIAWIEGEQGAGRLLMETATGWKTKSLVASNGVAVSDLALAAFHGELRLLAVTPDERFFEQRFDRAGDPAGSWHELEDPPSTDALTLGGLLQWGALAVLMVITLATANRGGVVQVAVVNKVRLAIAPLSLRLAAGLIDLWPFYLAPYLTLGHLQEGMKLSQLSADTTAYWALGITFAVYFLHTTIAEWIWGRSLGKMFVGLRVVALSGDKPSIASTLLRNLIRLVEVPIAVPLILVFLNPLRQRFGDFFAGTVVTMKLPREIQEKLD